MRVLCSIVQAFVLTVLHSWQNLSFCSPITPELIGNDHARNVSQSFEQLAKEAFGSFFVAPALHQDVEDITILIDRSPEVVFFSTESEYDLVHMPFVAATRTATTQFIGVGLPEFEAPLPYGFVGHNDPALCEKFLNRTDNESEKRK